MLFEQVCKQLNLLETDYFGLEYTDNRGSTYWLDRDKPMNQQVPLPVPVQVSVPITLHVTIPVLHVKLLNSTTEKGQSPEPEGNTSGSTSTSNRYM